MRVSFISGAILLACLVMGSAVEAVELTPKMRLKRLYKKKAKDPAPGALMIVTRPSRWRYDPPERERLVSARQYEDQSAACIAIMRQFAPHQHLIIGMGRDPAPLTAYLQNIDERLAINFPASGNGKGLKYEDVKPFLEHLLPKRRFGNRKLVLLDQTTSGKTLVGYGKFFERYLRELGLENEVIRLVLNDHKPRRMRGLTFMDTSAWPDVDEYRRPTGAYENTISEYAQLYLRGSTVDDLQLRPQYQRFRKAVRKRQVRDPKLDAFLAEYRATDFKESHVDSRSSEWAVQRPYAPLVQHKPIVGAQLVLPRVQQVRLLDPAAYMEYSSATTRLLEAFPAEQGRLYVGVGTSASPVMAMLDKLAPGRVGYLPIDNKTLGSRLAKQVPDLVRAFLKPRQLKRTQSIVLHHRGDGRVLAAVKKQLEATLKQMGYAITVDAIALHDKATAPGVEQLDIQGKKHLLGLRSADIAMVAPHASHILKLGAPAPKKERVQPNYEALKRALDPFMATDTPLDTMLRGSASSGQ